MRTLKELDLNGKRVLLRAGFDVPMREGKVTNDSRIKATLPTITTLLDRGASQVIIIAHAGRPGGKKVAELSLRPVAERLGELLIDPVDFVDDCLAKSLPETKVLLLENLRFHDAEKRNDIAFAKRLAAYGDVYVDDAFNVMHRSHASVEALPKLFTEKAIGLLVEKELKNLDFSEPERPFVAIIGAAKIADKIGILEALLEKVDKLLLGGAIIFPFFRAKGYEVGTSLCDKESIPIAKRLLEKHGGKIILPTDVVISGELEGSEIFTVDSDKIPKNMKGLDVGDQSIEEFKHLLDGAKTVFWNGPLGVFETQPFDHATNEIAEHLARMKTRVIVGGGDTSAAIDALGTTHYYTYVSTGGGAALQYIAGKKLPGLEALTIVPVAGRIRDPRYL